VLLKACLNGARPRGEHPALPITPEEIAAAGAGAVAAGARALHVHARHDDRRDSLEPEHVDRVVRALREACPGTPIGLTTGLWATPGPDERLASVAAWSELPDFVSANMAEPRIAELCDLLLDRGIGVEAGLWSVDDVDRLAALPSASRFLRVLVEALDEEPDAAVASAAAISARLDELGIDLPQLHHGAGMATWAVLKAAVSAGHEIRIGLEDTLVLPDGRAARDNAQLVTAAGAL